MLFFIGYLAFGAAFYSWLFLWAEAERGEPCAWSKWSGRVVLLFVGSVLMAMLSGCSTTPRQIIDIQGVDPAKFAKDNYECENYANQIDVGGSAATGAAGGALFGAVIGGILGGRDGALFGAKVFGVTGAAEGAGRSAADKKQVAARCMAGRGYRVLL